MLISTKLLMKLVDQHNRSLGVEEDPTLEERFVEGFEEGR